MLIMVISGLSFRISPTTNKTRDEMIAPPSHPFSNASFFLFIVILIGNFAASTRATFLFSPTSSPSSQTAAQLDYFYSPSRKRKAERVLIVK